jgi:hypothetical protein
MSLIKKIRKTTNLSKQIHKMLSEGASEEEVISFYKKEIEAFEKTLSSEDQRSFGTLLLIHEVEAPFSLN